MPLPTSFYRAGLAVLIIGVPLLVPAQAQMAQGMGALPRVITVSGEGQQFGRPDRAQLSAGVLAQAATAEAALTANGAAMNKVFAALKSLGIADAKIQTSNFSVSPQYPPYRQDNPEPQKIVGYQVSNQVTVIVDDLTKLGPALDALVKSGANQLNGVSFAISNPKPLAEAARKDAVLDATAKAKTLAAAAGVQLGPVLSIQEGDISRPMPIMAMARMEKDSTPIAAGEQSVGVSVTMTYGIQ